MPLIITSRMSVSFARMSASYGSPAVPSITSKSARFRLQSFPALVPFQDARRVARGHGDDVARGELAVKRLLAMEPCHFQLPKQVLAAGG